LAAFWFILSAGHSLAYVKSAKSFFSFLFLGKRKFPVNCNDINSIFFKVPKLEEVVKEKPVKQLRPAGLWLIIARLSKPVYLSHVLVIKWYYLSMRTTKVLTPINWVSLIVCFCFEST